MTDDGIVLPISSHIYTESALTKGSPININDYIRDSEGNIETFYGIRIRRSGVEQNTSYPSISIYALEPVTKDFN